VPLAVKGEVLGAMLIEAEDKVSRGQDKRVDIITGIAHQTALAIQNDRLQQEMAKNQNMERDIRLAREIQQGLLPSAMPNLPGWEIAVTYRAAREVGGDFYDFVELPGDRLGLVIADVADKGLPAAIFMVLTRALVHATSQGSLSPGATLTRVNDLLVPDARNGMFVTAAYAIVSWRTGEVTYASAGHNPPLVRRVETNEVERLDGRHGIALGALEDVILHDARASIGYGDYLVLYTDGVTEAYSTSQDAFFGETRFLEAVRSAPAESARMMLESVMCAIDQFVGDMPPSDDLTLLVLHRVDQGPAEEE